MNHFAKFYRKSRKERLSLLTEKDFISEKTKELFENNTLLDEAVANSLIENQLTQFPLPMGVALNFIVDGKEVVVPMVVEEPSVIAACSNGAKFMNPAGFTTTIQERGLIGQLIIEGLTDLPAAKKIIDQHQSELIAQAALSHPSIVKRGGGVTTVESRIVNNQLGQPEFLTIHLIVDVKDAMGANIVNTILEGCRPLVEKWLGGSCLMSILSNYNDHSLVTATCAVKTEQLGTANMDGQVLAERMVAATRYAHLDPYRAATHNKGIMNGIDSVLIATGNDARAVAAGAHAYASRHGHYASMSNWQLDEDGHLIGELTLPMPVGTVGGAISVLPMAKANQELLKCQSATDLARVVVAVGLAQNFSALKALVSDGIQKGHMNLHAKSLAIHVGATADEIYHLADLLRQEPTMNSTIASDLLNQLRSQKS